MRGRDHTHRLTAALNDVAVSASALLPVNDVLHAIVDKTCEITGAREAVIVLTAEHSEKLDFASAVTCGSPDAMPALQLRDAISAAAPEVLSGFDPVQVPVPGHQAQMLCASVRIREKPVGVICAVKLRGHRFSWEEDEYLAVLAAFAATAIENAQLAEQSRDVLLAVERERVAREMHDGVAQTLFSVSLGLEFVKKLAARDPDAVAPKVEEIQDQLAVALRDVRHVIYDLRSERLAEKGLLGAIEHWIMQSTTGRDVVGRIVLDTPERGLPEDMELCIYRIAKEAISNVVRHSEAEDFTVRFAFGPDEVVLTVADNGRGFDIAAADVVDSECEHVGLASMRERVCRARGRFRVQSTPGAGTTVEVRLPLGSG